MRYFGFAGTGLDLQVGWGHYRRLVCITHPPLTHWPRRACCYTLHTRMPALRCLRNQSHWHRPLRLVYTHITYIRTHVHACLLAQYVSEVVAAVAESPRNVKDTPAIVQVRVVPGVVLDTVTEPLQNMVGAAEVSQHNPCSTLCAFGSMQ